MTIEPKLLWLSLICIVYGVILLFFTKTIFKREVRPNQGIFVISLLGFNIGLFAYPFVETIWGTKGLKYIAFFDMGNAFLVFGLAYIAAVMYAPGNKQVDFRYIAMKLAIFSAIDLHCCINDKFLSYFITELKHSSVGCGWHQPIGSHIIFTRNIFRVSFREGLVEAVY